MYMLSERIGRILKELRAYTRSGKTVIDSFKMSRNISSQGANAGVADDESGSAEWKPVRDDFDEELTAALRQMNYQDAKKLIDELFVFFKSKGISLTTARVMVNSYVYHILRIAFEKNIKLNRILPLDREEERDFEKLKIYIVQQELSIELETLTIFIDRSNILTRVVKRIITDKPYPRY